MSASFLFADRHSVVQYFTTKGDIHVSKFSYIRICLKWPTGTRIRIKNLSEDRALQYVNKLHTGGWIDDDTYDTLYLYVNNLVSGFGFKEESL